MFTIVRLTIAWLGMALGALSFASLIQFARDEGWHAPLNVMMDWYDNLLGELVGPVFTYLNSFIPFGLSFNGIAKHAFVALLSVSLPMAWSTLKRHGDYKNAFGAIMIAIIFTAIFGLAPTAKEERFYLYIAYALSLALTLIAAVPAKVLNPDRPDAAMIDIGPRILGPHIGMLVIVATNAGLSMKGL